MSLQVEGGGGLATCHHPRGGVWLLEECLEQLRRVGRSIPRNSPQGSFPWLKGPLPSLRLVNWRFGCVEGVILYKMHI